MSRPRGPAPAAGYPAVYLLDGQIAAPVALAWLRRHRLADRVLVVGVDRPTGEPLDVARRYRDLAPVADAAHPGSGQAARLIDFLGGEIRMHVAERRRVDVGRQALFGHSLGGLTVLAAMLRAPTMFSDYWIASPSLWWADGAFRPWIEAFAHERGSRVSTPAYAMVVVGCGEQPRGEARGDEAPRRRRQRARRMVDGAVWLADTLAERADLAVSYHGLVGADHGQALERGVELGLRYWVERAPTNPGVPGTTSFNESSHVGCR